MKSSLTFERLVIAVLLINACLAVFLAYAVYAVSRSVEASIEDKIERAYVSPQDVAAEVVQQLDNQERCSSLSLKNSDGTTMTYDQALTQARKSGC